LYIFLAGFPVFPVFGGVAFSGGVLRGLLFIGALVCLGRRTLTRIIWANGGEQRNWSSEYFLRSRVHWEPQGLFAPILERALGLCPG